MSNEFAQSDSWNHPIPNDDAQYAFSSTKQTRGGHVFEIDDTLGNERIAEHHKSGTSRTIKADGSSDIIIVGDAWITIIRDGHILINGEVNVTMAKTVKLHCKKLEIEVEGDMNTTVHGNYNLKVDKNYAVEVVGDSSEKIKGDKKLECKNYSPTISGNVEETITKKYTSNVGKDYNMISTGSSSITAGKNGSFKSSEKISIGGSSVAIDAAKSIKLTSLGTTSMLSTMVDVKSPIVKFSGTVTAMGDVMTMQTGPVSLSSHIHMVLSIPTTPPIV